MGTILTVASQKGGVGKTTTAVNLAYNLSLAQRKVLFLDLDPQGNGSSGLGVPGQSNGADEGYLSRALRNRPLDPCLKRTRFDNLTVLPSCLDLSRLEKIQELQDQGFTRLARQVRRLADSFDFVLVDCPPSLAGLPTAALGLSDLVLIPVQCEYYAMEGLSQILPIIQKVIETTNENLEISGLLLTMFSEELDLSHDVVREITEYFRERRPDAVFKTIIPRDVTLAEAASHGVPALDYAPYSRGAWSYLELAKEILQNERT